jgi:hypothetical protein
MKLPSIRNATLQQLLAVLVVVCLVVKPIVVALHLAHHEHTSELGAAEGHHSHRHGHEHAHDHPHDHQVADVSNVTVEHAPASGEDPTDHPPHPASDHDEQAKVRVATGDRQSLECGPAVTDWGAMVVPLVVETVTARRPATGPPRTDRRTGLLATTVLLI